VINKRIWVIDNPPSMGLSPKPHRDFKMNLSARSAEVLWDRSGLRAVHAIHCLENIDIPSGAMTEVMVSS
jgi:hypothetical protein